MVIVSFSFNMHLQQLFLLFGGLLIFLPFISSFTYDGGIEYCEQFAIPKWIKFNNNCYLFYQDSRSKVSFYEAEDSCRVRGGHLASIHSEEENSFFLKMAQKFGGRRWIGLNIFKGNDTPEWIDGTRVNYTKTIPKEFYKNEKCFIFMSAKGGWRPEHCGLHNYPVCKMSADKTPSTIPPPTTVPPPVGYCPEDWLQFGQKCYKFFGKDKSDRLDFKKARDACWALGKNHDLVSIHNMKEQAFLTEHVYDFGSSPWIGIQKIESDEIGHDLVFGWIDNSRKEFTSWATGHPPLGTWKYCGRLSNDTVAKGEWIADYCELDKKGYICQRPTDPSVPKPNPEPTKCGVDFVGYRNSCYQYVSKPKTRDNAEQSCKQLGGHLLSITDGFEQSFLYNFIPETTKFLWNGLSSVQGTQYFKWSDGQPVYYFNWVEGRSNFSKTKQMCSYLDRNNGLKWNMADCKKELPYVCKKTDQISPKFPEVLGYCPGNDSSWIDVGDENCYQLAESKYHVMSWDSSFRYCISKGMKMIVTNSTHQIKFLIAYLWKEDYSINLGIIRKFDKSSFMWVDGKELEFTNWDVREPSDYPEDRGCVAFSQMTGKWKTIPCNAAGVTLCQVPKMRISG